MGGYSPAKLQRYQDLIEKYLQREINTLASSMRGVATVSELEASMPHLPLLSALNTRYIIIDGSIAPARNAGAFGNAWFVSEVIPAATPSEELDLLGSTDLRCSAVVGADYIEKAAAVCGVQASASDAGAADAAGITLSGDDFADSQNSIELIYYSPNELRYRYNLTGDALAVFSEVFYPEGWDAWLDGDPSRSVDVFRADWVLRAAVLPEGSHELTMRFEPQTIRGSVAVSRASSAGLIVLLLLVLAGTAAEFKRRRV